MLRTLEVILMNAREIVEILRESCAGENDVFPDYGCGCGVCCDMHNIAERMILGGEY